MSRLIDAEELELDTEWSDYYDGFTSYSQSQIDEAEEVKAISLEKVKQARKKIENLETQIQSYHNDDPMISQSDVLEILDKLIEEVEYEKG